MVLPEAHRDLAEGPACLRSHERVRRGDRLDRLAPDGHARAAPVARQATRRAGRQTTACRLGAYFQAAYPGFPDPSEKLGTRFAPPGQRAGTLRAEVAARLGLSPGGGGRRQRRLVRVGPRGRRAESRSVLNGHWYFDLRPRNRSPRGPHAGDHGVVENGILPGFFGYEAGQAAVGDMFAWFGGRLLGLKSGEPGSGGSWHEEFERAAAKLAPGASGLVALDWWNGNRTILGDADLSGVIAGLTLATTPTEIYRALLESVAFGTRRIVENFVEHDVDIQRDRRMRRDSRTQRAHDAAARRCDRAAGYDSPTRARSPPAVRRCAVRLPQVRRRVASMTSKRRSPPSHRPCHVDTSRRRSTARPTTGSTRSSVRCTMSSGESMWSGSMS